jgi:GT2 family glycosyltransferase
MLLSIVIVNSNSWNYLRNCIESIRMHSEGIDYEIIVIDNSSTDESVGNIRIYFPEAVLIANKENVGFPVANNQGFAIAKGKYLLALNPDTVVKEDTLQKSIDVLESNENIGCLGVKTLRSDGAILLHCARRFPTLWGAFWEMFYIDKLFGSWRFLNSSDMPYWDHCDSRDVDMLHGGYMMFPRSIYEQVGGFNTKVKLFYEDIEYCARMRKAGYRIHYLADAEIVHFVGKSTAKAKRAWIIRMQYDALYYFFYEYAGGKAAAISYVFLVLITAPLRLLWMPVVATGYLISKREKLFYALFLNVVVSVLWGVRKTIETLRTGSIA